MSSFGPCTPGIDVSHYQGRIDWHKVARYEPPGGHGPVRFTYLKASQGKGYRDPTFPGHRQEARAEGLLVGAYHVIELDTPDDVLREADNLIDAIRRLRPGELPPAIDAETKYIKAAPSPRSAVDQILAFAGRVVERLHRWSVLYISPRGLAYLGDQAARFPMTMRLWICDYDDDPLDEIPAFLHSSVVLWQRRSDLPGAEVGAESRKVDLDYWRGDLSELRRWASFPSL